MFIYLVISTFGLMSSTTRIGSMLNLHEMNDSQRMDRMFVCFLDLEFLLK